MSSSEEDDDFDIEAYQREGEIQAEEDPYNLNYIQDDKGQQEMKEIKEEFKKQIDQKKALKFWNICTILVLSVVLCIVITILVILIKIYAPGTIFFVRFWLKTNSTLYLKIILQGLIPSKTSVME